MMLYMCTLGSSFMPTSSATFDKGMISWVHHPR